MPEEQERQYYTDLNTLHESQSVTDLSEAYERRSRGKEDGGLMQVIAPLNYILTKDENGRPRASLENLLVNATPQAVEKEVSQYHKKTKDTVEESIERSKGRISDDYIEILDQIIQQVVEHVTSQEGFDKLDDKRRDEIIRPEIYKALVEFLNRDRLNPMPEALAKAKKGFDKLDNPNEDDLNSTVNGYLMEGVGLSSNAVNLVDKRDVYNKNAKRATQIFYERVIASGLVKYNEQDKEYSISKESFVKAYGSNDNYRRLASNFAKMIQERAQREAA